MAMSLMIEAALPFHFQMMAQFSLWGLLAITAEPLDTSRYSLGMQ